MLTPWWERFPGRLDYELEALRGAGIRFELDEREFASGIVLLRLTVPLQDEEVRLVVKFPDFYPFVRFEIFAPDLVLPHHQNPFLKNLCFIALSTENWRTDDTVADFITGRLSTLLHVARSDQKEEVVGLEEIQGEPITAYYTFQQDSFVLVDSSWNLDPAIDRGELTLGLLPSAGVVFRGAVLEVRDKDGRLITKADPAIHRICAKQISGRWLRIERPILEDDPQHYIQALSQGRSQVKYTKWKNVPNGQVDVLGIIFPEEVAWRKTKDGWLFVIRFKQRKELREGAYFARPARAGHVDMSARLPTRQALRKSCVAVVGLGCLGAPSAIELAKTGVKELRLLDPDFVEPGTTVRWPLGLAATGRRKVSALRDFLAGNFPFTEVKIFPYRIGDVVGDRPPDRQILGEFLQDIDLLYDATAEIGIQHLLSTLTYERSIPYISVSATSGAWGGQVVRVRASETSGCWFCFRLFLDQGTFPIPPANDAVLAQPEGCRAPTFTGPAFDLQEVVMTGVRLAVSTLSTGHAQGYPSLDWDVGILSLRNVEGVPVPPMWRIFPLEKHPKCPLCRPRSA